MVNQLVRDTYDPSTKAQVALGAGDGERIQEIPTSGMETIYGGSEMCPGCGRVMNPMQVIFGYGLCPDCQSLQNAARMKDRMS